MTKTQCPICKRGRRAIGAWSLVIWSLIGISDLVIGISAPTTDPALKLIHTHHYDIHTDVDDALITDLSSRMDAMYDQYVKTFSDLKPPANTAAWPVYLFETHEKYMAFTDYAGTNTGGLFVSGRRPYLTAYDQGQGRDALRRTLQHEAFHQFAYFNISRRLPPWMNEGMAQLFEESVWVGKDFETDQIPPRRLRQLRADIVQKRLIDFDQFVNMTPNEWRGILHTNVQKSATCYNQAWAMAYFCSSAGDAGYHADFVQLLQKLHDNNEAGEATKKCFPDLKDFRNKFNIWAAKAEATPQATLLEHEDTLGDFLMTVTQKNHPVPADMAAFRKLAADYKIKIQYTRNGVSYTTAEDPMVYFADSTGNPFTPEELKFQPAAAAPLPDIICQPNGSSVRYRTHFYTSAGKTEHEVLIEPP